MQILMKNNSVIGTSSIQHSAAYGFGCRSE